MVHREREQIFEINSLLAIGIKKVPFVSCVGPWLVCCVLNSGSNTEKRPNKPQRSPKAPLMATRVLLLASCSKGPGGEAGAALTKLLSFEKWLLLVNLMSYCHLRRSQNHDPKVCTFRTDSNVSLEWKTQRDLKEEVKRTSNAEKTQVRVRCHQEGMGTGLRLLGAGQFYPQTHSPR